MKKGIIQLMLANVLYMLISVLNSFLLPKFLSMDTYAVLKTYTLYIGYAGFLSLGYADGMYLRYGGGEIDQIEKTEFGSSFQSYLLLELAVSAICLGISFFVDDFVLMAFALGSLCINVIGYYKNLYQAVGEYKLYGKALNYQTILMFALNMAFLFLLKLDDAGYYVMIQVVSACLVMIYLTAALNKRTSLLRCGKPSVRQICSNIKSGFVLMLGNFSSSIITSIDRWFVKGLMDSVCFAQYSFAVSLENIVNTFISPITISLYNTFCKNRAPEYVRKIKKMVLLWGFVVIAAAFPVKFVVCHFLPGYTQSLQIMFPLLGAQVFYTVIKGIHINLYKAEKKQTKYFVIMFAMIAVSVITNILFYALFRSAWSFAVATYVTALIWFVYSEIETKALRFDAKEYLALICVMSGYFFAAGQSNTIAGLGIYCLVLAGAIALFMRQTVKEIWDIGRSYFKKKRETT